VRAAAVALVVFVVLGASALVTAGCGGGGVGDGGGATPEVTLRFWGLGREGEVVREMVPEFERANPGVHVEVQQIPWIAADSKLLTAVVGESTPDVAQLGNTWIAELVALEALAGLGDRVAASAAVDRDAYFPGIWDANVLGGEVWGVPWYVDTRLLFYRSDLLAAAGVAEPPRTWAAWREAMERVREHTGPDRWAILLPVNEFEQPVILGLEQGSTLLADGGRHGAFSQPPFVRAMEFYVGLFRDGLAPVVSYNQVGNVYQDFARGDYAFYITGPWNLGEFASRLPPELQDAWATAPMPARDASTGEPGASIAGGASLVVFRRSPHQDAAWRFIEFLSSPAQQLRLHELSGDLPARIAAWDDPALAGDPRVAAFRRQLANTVPMPKVPEWQRISIKLAERIEPAVRGRQSAAEALAGLDADVDRMLEKRRWLLDRPGAAGAEP
jgi:multiple sugar transport system substrate-binding protein